MADGFTAKVVGLAELGRAFRKLDAELPVEANRRLAGIAGIVASIVRGMLPHRLGVAADSVQASDEGLTLGGPSAPYYPWLDYGGNVGRKRSVHRPYVSGGRYLYPTLKAQAGETARALEDAAADVARKAGFEVRR
jgi:hypothetical protein